MHVLRNFLVERPKRRDSLAQSIRLPHHSWANENDGRFYGSRHGYGNGYGASTSVDVGFHEDFENGDEDFEISLAISRKCQNLCEQELMCIEWNQYVV